MVINIYSVMQIERLFENLNTFKYTYQYLLTNLIGNTMYGQLRARRVLSIFKDVPLWTRRALLLYYHACGNSALLVLNRTSLNSDSALLALNWWSVVEGCYQYSKMFHCEPEGGYCCTIVVIAPFWFSTEHLWIVIAPFWLSTDDMLWSRMMSLQVFKSMTLLTELFKTEENKRHINV